jgi:hypothetical protein
MRQSAETIAQENYEDDDQFMIRANSIVRVDHPVRVPAMITEP